LFQAVVALVQRRRHVRELLSVLAMGMLPGILFGVYQAKSDISLGNLPHFINLGRINATFSDPNALGVFLALVLPVLFGFALGVRRKPEKAGLFVLCALGLTTLAYSGSRTGFLGLALALLTAGYLTLRERNTRKSRWALIVTIFFGAVFFGGLFLSPPRKIASFGDQDAILPRRIAQVFVTVRDEGLLTMLNRERLRAWRESLTVIGEHPVAGIGLGTYWIEIPTFLGFNPGDPGYRDNASNKYLQVWAETGFLGLAFFGAILALIAVEALRGNRHHRAGGATPLAPSLRRYAAGSVLAMVFIYITGPHDAFPEIQIIFWLLIGLIHAKGSPPLSSISAVERDGGNKTPARRTWIWRGTAWLIAALIVLIQARSGWVCLSPSSPGREDRWMLASGFYPWQYAPNGERYRWTREESSVEMKLPDSASGLSTWLMIAHPDTARRPVEVRVYVNDVCEAVEVFSAPNERRDLALRVGAGESRRVVARFVVSRVYVPARHDPGNLDRRRLGVLVGDLVPLISPN
jgi:O-antigen ligase